VGIGGGFYIHHWLEPSPRPIVVYPLAVVLSGALAALQFGHARLTRYLILGLFGSFAAAWSAVLIFPLPGPRLALGPGFTWYHTILLSAAAGVVGLFIGLVYALAAALIRWLRRQPAPGEIPLRFSLQKLFIAVTLLAMFFGATAFRLQQFAREKVLADRWSRAGVTLTFDYWGRPKGGWTVPNTTLDDHSLADLAELTSLRALNLSGANLTDAGMPHLQRLSSLRYLTVAGLPLTDASVSDLISLPSLRYLDLFGTQATPATIAVFAAERPSLTIRVKTEIIRQAAGSKSKSGSKPMLTADPMKFPY